MSVWQRALAITFTLTSPALGGSILIDRYIIRWREKRLGGLIKEKVGLIDRN